MNNQTLTAGTVLASSWGYDQTNWDFFKVVRRTKTQVVLVKLETIKEDDGPTAMTGTIRPAVDRPVGKEFRRKVLDGYNGEPLVKLESYAYARPWDGQPKKFSTYA